MSEVIDTMLAMQASLRASTSRYRSHNQQIAAVRAAECQVCRGTGLHPDKAKGLCPTCKGRRTR